MRLLLAFFPVLLAAQQSAAPPKPAPAAKPAVFPKAAVAAKPAPAPRPAAAAKAPAALKRAVPGAKPAPGPALNTDDEKTIYALGLSIFRSITPFDLSPAELEIVKRALSDAQAGKPALEVNEWGPKLQPLSQARADRVRDREKQVSKAFLDKAATEAGAVRTDSGLVFKDLTAGTGASPTAESTVKVHYRGTLVNGTEFDSSYKRNEPAEFALNRVVKCWTEGLQKMKAGGKARLVCPAELAYGDQGRPSIPPGAALIFEVELLEVK